MTNRTWRDNAAEFAELDEGEGWPFARLIACSVEKGKGEGGDPDRNDRYGGDGQKVSANEFAREARTSAPRVSRYLTAWDKAAAQGLCVAAADLTPDDSPTAIEPDVPWKSMYDATNAGGRPRDSKVEDAVTIISRRGAAAVLDAMPAEARADLAREAVKRAPEVVEEANDAAWDSARHAEIGAETTRKIKEGEDRANRSSAVGLELSMKVHILGDQMVRYEQWTALRHASDYLLGLVEAHEGAKELTPEMFS